MVQYFYHNGRSKNTLTGLDSIVLVLVLQMIAAGLPVNIVALVPNVHKWVTLYWNRLCTSVAAQACRWILEHKNAQLDWNE